MRQATTFVFLGSFVPERFIDFAEHRARRLDLSARLGPTGARAVTVSVEGEPDLIDAFEMACSLGPLDCIVRDIERRDGVNLEDA